MVSPHKLKIRFMEQALYELEDKHNLNREVIEVNGRDIEYEPIVRLIVDINTKATNDEIALIQQFILKKGLKEYGDAGYKAALKEVAQLHKRTCFTPLPVLIKCLLHCSINIILSLRGDTMLVCL